MDLEAEDHVVERAVQSSLAKPPAATAAAAVRSVYAQPAVRPRRHSPVPIVGPVLLIALTVLITQGVANYVGAAGNLSVRVEQQQAVALDLRSTSPRSPNLVGMNVFPPSYTRATDGSLGFMPYDKSTYDGLEGASVALIRFPGGSWGEQHTASYEQLNAFLNLASSTKATPLIQVRLSGGSPQQAAALVSYCNASSDQTRHLYPGVPQVHVRYWEIGNEPDLRGPDYTVADYVRDFIAFSTAMLSVDPTIKILGPGISQFNGPGAGPFDSKGKSWLDDFLRQIAAYDQAHNTHLLGGVSLHRYPFAAGVTSASLLFASVGEWQYNLPALRAEMRQLWDQELPIAITEVNTSVQGGSTADPYITALWWADTLGTLMQNQVDDVSFFGARGLTDTYTLLTQQGDPTPIYRVMEIYSHMQPNVIALGSKASPVPVYATTNDAGDTLSLVFVNELEQSVSASITAGGFVSGWHDVHVELPQLSLACIVLHRGNGAQMYLYDPFDQHLGDGAAGSITMRQIA